MTSLPPAAMTERLIDAAIYAETAQGAYRSGADREVNEARGAIEALLSELSALRAERKWQTIETAPMDGRVAIVCRPLAHLTQDEPVAVKRPLQAGRGAMMRGALLFVGFITTMIEIYAIHEITVMGWMQ